MFNESPLKQRDYFRTFFDNKKRMLDEQQTACAAWIDCAINGLNKHANTADREGLHRKIEAVKGSLARTLASEVDRDNIGRYGSVAILRLGIKAEQTTSFGEMTGGLLQRIEDCEVGYVRQARDVVDTVKNVARGAMGKGSPGGSS